MSIKATKDNAKFVSKVYTQEASDTDWAKAKPKVKFKYKEVNVLDNSTTSELVIEKSISEGDIIVVNDNEIKKKILKDSDILQNENLVDNPDPFGDGSGIDLWKLDGNANSATGQHNGTWYGNEAYDVGVFGQGAKFDGDSYIYADTEELNDFTISFFVSVYDVNDNTNRKALSIFNVNGNKPCIAFDFNYEKAILIKKSDNSTWNDKTIDLSNVNTSNKFYHIVVARTSNTLHLYIDGNNIDNVDYSDIFAKTGRQLVISKEAGYGNYFKGVVDQVRIFNRALTAEEIQKLYIEEVSKFNVSDLNLSQTPSKIWMVDGSIITTKGGSTTTKLVLPPNNVKLFDTLILNDGTEKEIVVRSVERDSDGNDVVQLGQELALVPSEVAKVDVPEVIVDVEPTEQELLVDDIELEKESSTKTQFVGTSIKNIPISSDMEVILDNKAVVTNNVNIENMSIVDKVDPFGDNSGVALWKLDGNANDTGGNHNGTWHGNEQYDTGKFGQAGKFDGNSRIDIGDIIPDILNSGANNEISFSCWVSFTDAPNKDEIILTDYDSGDSDFIVALVNTNGYIKVYIRGKNHTKDITSANLYNDGKFHFVTINIKIYEYLNVVIDDQETLTLDISSITYNNFNGFFRLGCHRYNSTYENFYNGLIDQVRIFNRTLTNEEVQILYNEEKYKYTLTFPEQPQAPQTCLVPAKGERVKLTPFQMSYDENSNALLKEAQEFEKTGRALQYAIKSPKDIEISQLNIDLWKKQ